MAAHGEMDSVGSHRSAAAVSLATANMSQKSGKEQLDRGKERLGSIPWERNALHVGVGSRRRQQHANAAFWENKQPGQRAEDHAGCETKSLSGCLESGSRSINLK